MSNARPAISDPRGHMHREKRLMGDGDALGFLRSQKVAHVGTVDEAGWPYVIPLIYIYEGDERLYLHTGDHHGHFVRNVQHNPRICVEVGEMGAVHRGQPFACNSALVFTSVIVFGQGPHPRRSRQEELVLRSKSRKVRRVGLDVRAGIPIARSDHSL